jgi:hypothetical protein
MRPITAIFSVLLLTGCVDNSDQPPPVVVKQYTIPEQQCIVKEWNALPDDSCLQSPLNDWERMRQELK